MTENDKTTGEFHDGADLSPLGGEISEATPAAEPAMESGSEQVDPKIIEPLADLNKVAEAEQSTATAAVVPMKFCVVCHSQIPASSRVCPICSAKVVLYEGTAHKQYWKFLVGFLMVVLGCFMPWQEVYPSMGFHHVTGFFVLLAGLYGLWKMYIAIVANRFSLGPIGVAFLLFFFSLYQFLSMAAEFKYVKAPAKDAKVLPTARRITDMSIGEWQEYMRAAPKIAGEAPQPEAQAPPEEKKVEKKGFWAALVGFGDDDIFSLRRNIAHWGSGRLIVFLGSLYILWVFFCSFFGLAGKKKSSKGASGRKSGASSSAAARRRSGATGNREGRRPLSSQGSSSAEKEKTGKATEASDAPAGGQGASADGGPPRE